MSRIRIAGLILLAVSVSALGSTAYADSDGLVNAKWCLTTANKLIKDQPLSSGLCIADMAQDPKVALKSQRQLASEAIGLAKSNKENDALEKLAICQCHNPEARDSIFRDRAEVLNWLKSQ